MFQVYWPVDLLRSLRKLGGNNALVLGVAVGNSSVVVVNAVTYNELDELVQAQVVRRNGKQGYLLTCEGVETTIVGYIGHPVPSGSGKLRQFVLENDVVRSSDSIIIAYDPPLPDCMQLYTVTPIEIYLSQGQLDRPKNVHIELIKQHGHDHQYSPQDEHFADAVDSLNKCWPERHSLMNQIPQLQRSWEQVSRSQRIRLSLLHSLCLLLSLFSIIFTPFKKTWVYLIIILRHLCLYVIRILNATLTKTIPSLIELSATAQQIDLRLQQFCYLPIQYIRTARQLRSSKPTAAQKEKFADYIRLYNTLWLVINDVTLGFMVSSFLIENEKQLAHYFDNWIVSRILYTDLKNILSWLMNSPGGIKLNNELCVFLGDFFRWIIEFWNATLISFMKPHYAQIIHFIGLCSMFGATFGIAVFSDILSIMTFHIYCFYIASAKIYHGQLSAIRSLFRLFMGQKRNILRRRIDSNNYELDQLLLGTLLFISLSFLVPTVLIFYITFTITSVIILGITALMEIAMASLNHFPLFILLLRLKDYKRVPRGVETSSSQGYIHLDIKPIYFADMFIPFSNVLHKLRISYLCVSVLGGILIGRPVHVQRNNLYRMLYSSLPPTQMSTKDLILYIRTSSR